MGNALEKIIFIIMLRRMRQDQALVDKYKTETKVTSIRFLFINIYLTLRFVLSVSHLWSTSVCLMSLSVQDSENTVLDATVSTVVLS